MARASVTDDLCVVPWLPKFRIDLIPYTVFMLRRVGVSQRALNCLHRKALSTGLSQFALVALDGECVFGGHIWLWLKKLATKWNPGNMDKNLRNPSCLILSHTH